MGFEGMVFFFKAGLFLHPQRSAFILTSELTAADERPARSSYLSPSFVPFVPPLRAFVFVLCARISS